MNLLLGSLEKIITDPFLCASFIFLLLIGVLMLQSLEGSARNCERLQNLNNGISTRINKILDELDEMTRKCDIMGKLLFKEKNKFLEKRDKILHNLITNRDDNSEIKSSEEDRCTICLKRESVFVSTVCEHKLYCNKCIIYRLDLIVKIKNCPICRKKVKEVDTME